VPLNRQMLAGGLPELLAKLAQLDDIEAIIAFHPNLGPICEAKRELIGSLGPKVRLFGGQEYAYANPIIGNVIVDGVDRRSGSVPPPRVPQDPRGIQSTQGPQRVATSDEQRRNLIRR
jgi:hypothetical protein